MDSKIKIRVIDSTDKRRKEICEAIQPYNSLKNSCCSDFYEKNKIISETDIDLFLLHINDQTKDDNPFYAYLQDIDKKLPDAPIVFYSGGGISVTEHSKTKINITQGDKKPWDFDVCNGDRFCIVKRNINKASDLNITAALSRYIATSLKEDFFKFVLDIGKPHIIALSILCQGYLAAHWEEIDNSKKECLSGLKAWDSLPSELRDKVKANKDMTEEQGWWKPAFGTGKNFGNTGVGKNLKAMDKGESDGKYKSIEALFMNTKGGTVVLATVDSAYKSLSTILKG